MPATDVKITANFAYPKAYTVTGATVTTSGSAVPGTFVRLQTDLNKDMLTFKEWTVAEGEGVVIANPKAVVTGFTMIDGPVSIEAVYAPVYVIDIVGGDCILEAFEGDEVAVTSHTGKGEFAKWVSDTDGVEFADATAPSTTFVMPASDVHIEAVFATTGVENVELPGATIITGANTVYVSGLACEPVEIYNVAGQLVEKVLCEGEVSIDITNIPAGMYIVKAASTTKKFIKR